jgi:hypothetical protein
LIEKPAQRESSVVRIWREEGQPEWKGRVQHVYSGDSASLQDLQDLVIYLEQRTAEWPRGEKRGLR